LPQIEQAGPLAWIDQDVEVTDLGIHTTGNGSKYAGVCRSMSGNNFANFLSMRV
jgi:hypothetical protein